MKRVEEFLSDENIKNITALAWSGEKCKFYSLSDFERFAFTLENPYLFVGNRIMDMQRSAVLYDTNGEFDICTASALSRDDVKALWERIFSLNGVETSAFEYKKESAENARKCEELLDNSCDMLYSQAKRCGANALRVESFALSLAGRENATHESFDGLPSLLLSELEKRNATSLSVSFVGKVYKRPDAYSAERIFRNLSGDENYNQSDNADDILTLSLWLLCRALMKSELCPCIYVNSAEQIKIFAEILARLRIERQIKVCIDYRRADVDFLREFVALAKNASSRISLCLTCADDVSREDFVKHTHSILYAIPFGAFCF